MDEEAGVVQAEETACAKPRKQEVRARLNSRTRGLPGGAVAKNLPCSEGGVDLIPRGAKILHAAQCGFSEKELGVAKKISSSLQSRCNDSVSYLSFHLSILIDRYL